MKISEMIQNLQEFMAEHGDLDCYYAVDDEGNDYKNIYYTPTLFYVDDEENVYSRYDWDEMDEEDHEGLMPICVVN